MQLDPLAADKLQTVNFCEFVAKLLINKSYKDI